MTLRAGDPITVLADNDRSLRCVRVGPAERLLTVPSGNEVLAYTAVNATGRRCHDVKRFIFPDAEDVYWTRGHVRTKKSRAALLAQFLLTISADRDRVALLRERSR